MSAVLDSWGLPRYASDDAVLVVSELVTNAVVHGKDESSLELEVVFGDAWLRISLTDGSAIRPMARDAASGDENGRGMAIVSALADRWDVEDHEGGKRIWFEIDLARLAPTAAEQAGDDAWDRQDA